MHGFAAGGGGFGLVCASDLVVAAESARFLLGATRVGMAPDAGGTVTLAKLVGLRKAMEMAMLNPTLTAAEALELGLVTRVVPDDALLDEAWALARQLAAGATRALAATKRMIWDGLGATRRRPAARGVTHRVGAVGHVRRAGGPGRGDRQAAADLRGTMTDERIDSGRRASTGTR